MGAKRIALVGKDDETERFFGKRLKEYKLEAHGELSDLDLDDPPDLVVLKPAGELDDGHAPQLERLNQQAVPFIVVSTVETMKSAVNAMTRGALDYFLSSDDREDIAETVLATLEPPRPAPRIEAFDEEADFDDHMIGQTPKIQEVFKLIGKIAESNVSVLLRGDSGTGKELVARQIHKNSDRSSHSFVCIDCAAIPRELVENELFGHEIGAYSGAETRATGKFDLGNHGTVFLDEIGEMDLDLQSKILRVIQESEFYRVGGNQPIKIDVRIIVATQSDLETLVKNGGFRADLYHRLNVITLTLPPLTERADDVPLLAQFFLTKHCRTLDIAPRLIGADFMRAMQRYHWPGNVRQLENVIRRSLLLERGTVLSGRHFDHGQSGGSDGDRDSRTFSRLLNEKFLVDEINWKRLDVYKQMTRKIERLLVKLVLRETKGNQVMASRILGISRNTLRVKMQELGLVSSTFK